MEEEEIEEDDSGNKCYKALGLCHIQDSYVLFVSMGVLMAVWSDGLSSSLLYNYKQMKIFQIVEVFIYRDCIRRNGEKT